MIALEVRLIVTIEKLFDPVYNGSNIREDALPPETSCRTMNAGW